MYVKLFTQILESTIWTESLETKILWITMLAKSDADGLVDCTVPGLAKLAGISIEECESGLDKFRAPDKYSRTQESEGRRVVDVEGGWVLLNYTKYREIASKERKREMTRKRVEKHRDSKKPVTPVKRKKAKSNGSRSASASASKSNKKADPEKEVFEYWRDKTGRTNMAKLDAKRRRLIKARLAETYTVADLKSAVDGCMASPYHQGKNESKTVYTSLELIFRDAGKMEDFMLKSRHPSGSNGQQQQEQTPEQKAATKNRVDRLVAMGLERKA